jgi:hypothetical protein
MNVWLIDFEFCERTHILKDILKIEADLLFEYTKIENDQQFEEGLLILKELAQVEDLSKPVPKTLKGLSSPHFIRLWTTIAHLRMLLVEIVHESASPFQADLVLLRYSLFALALEHFQENSKRLALAASCMWAQKIQHRFEKNLQYRVDWVHDNIGIAQLPGRKDKGGDMIRDLDVLKQQGIKSIVCLCTPMELEKLGGDLRVEAKKLGFDLLVHNVASKFIPTCDGTRRIVTWLIEKLHHEEKCCVVSFSGLGRSCIIACSLLVMMDYNLPIEQAIEKIKSVRGIRAFESDQQLDLVHRVHKTFHSEEEICELAPW